ncbi:protein CMSS1 isoform X2 [Denticeps clupeoides]|uniref:Protein CMSS1 n=1 Tax=Denticeps clupeoides TaxID=299321 RepID=A0AAY4BHE1_9TELE|nr:protein CMSS1 isoform X2 [Denticeps clupeoides]
MGDDLGEEWWIHGDNSGVSDGDEDDPVDTEDKKEPEHPGRAKKRKNDPAGPQRKAKKNKTECFITKDVTEEPQTSKTKKRRKKKKTITDVLAASESKPASPAELQKLLQAHLSTTCSVIEQDELSLQDSSFLTSNDLTHSLSSYLKEVCPKWAKLQKHHTATRSLVIVIVCSSALRTIELIKQLTAFKGGAKVLKLFAKHIKLKEQLDQLGKGVAHIGVGTPARLSTLIDREGLSLDSLRYLVLDWNWRDQKQRRMVDVPEVKSELLKLLECGVLQRCREGTVKIGLF